MGVQNVRLTDETAFPFPDPYQSFGALQRSKRADSRLRSPPVRPRHHGREDIRKPIGPSTGPGSRTGRHGQRCHHAYPWGRCPQTPGVLRIGPRGAGLAAKAGRAAGKARGTARRHTPHWRRPPLRVPSGRAVSCGRQSNIPRKRPVDNPFLSPQPATTDSLTEPTAQKKIRSNQHPPLTNLIAGNWFSGWPRPDRRRAAQGSGARGFGGSGGKGTLPI